MASLQATAYLDIPQANASPYRIWENVNYTLKTSGVDVTRAISANFGALSNPSPSQMQATLGGGQMTLGYSKTGASDDISYSSNQALTSVTLSKAEGDLFGSPAKLQAVIIPTMTNADPRMNNGQWSKPPITKQIQDLSDMARITLTRQADGSYAATAPKGKCFFEIAGMQEFDGPPYANQLTSAGA